MFSNNQNAESKLNKK